MKNKVFYLPKFKDSGTLPKSTNKWLKTIGETILDFTPIVGDIKGLTIDPYKAYKEKGWGAGLKMAGLGLIGLVPGVGDIAKKAGTVVLKSVNNIPFIFRNDNLKKIHELSDARLANVAKSTIFTNNKQFVNAANNTKNFNAYLENPFDDPLYTFNIDKSLLKQRLNSGATDRVGYKWANSPSAGYAISPEKYKPTLTKISGEQTAAYTNHNFDWNKSKINLNPDDLKRLKADTEQKILAIYDHEWTHLLDAIFRDHTITSKSKISINDWFPKREELLNTFNDRITTRLRKEGVDINSDVGQNLYKGYMSMAREQLYKYLSDPSEQIARGVQIKNAAGITDGSKVFTPEEIKQMWEDYRKKAKLGEVINNNMNHTYHYLNVANKWDEYAKWFNRAVPGIIPIWFGSKMFINQNQEEKINEDNTNRN